jgi:hypothetical protein
MRSSSCAKLERLSNNSALRKKLALWCLGRIDCFYNNLESENQQRKYGIVWLTSDLPPDYL